MYPDSFHSVSSISVGHFKKRYGLTSTACEDASRSYEELRRKGKMIGEFDILIGSIVKFHDEKLLTRDAVFKSIS